MDLIRRVKRVEGKTDARYKDIIALIQAGAVYSDLTYEQKCKYLNYAYHGIFKSPERYEEIVILFSFPEAPYGFLHTPEDISESGIFNFKLQYRQSKTTKIDDKRRAEIEEYLTAADSPEEQERFKENVRILQRINELRKAAVARGLDPNIYPTPWQKDYEAKKYLYAE